MRKLGLLILCVLFVVPAAPGEAVSDGNAAVQTSWADIAARSKTMHARSKTIPHGRAPQRSHAAPHAGTADPQRAPLAPGSALSASPTLATNFQGALNDTTDCPSGPSCNDVIPPDTGGAVGPSHVVSVNNQAIVVKTRTGGAVTNGTVLLDAFWDVLSGPPIAFDPRIAFDQFIQRWVLVSTADGDASSSRILVAVSNTTNPTGSWLLYQVDADPANNLWADYPSIGFNKDWLVVTTNMFCLTSPATSACTSGQFVRSNIYVFRTASLAAGTQSFKLFTDADGFTQSPATVFDGLTTTMYLVENLSGDEVDPDTSQHYGIIRIAKISGAVGSETYTAGNNAVFALTTATWNDNNDLSFAGLPQKDIPNTIDGGDARMGTCSYRNGSVWCAHTVFLPATSPTRAAVQWWQIVPSTGQVQQRGRIDDGTGTNMYAYPSLAVNSNNDAILGFSHFSSAIYAEANYAFRSASDAANTMRDRAVLQPGQASYLKTLTGPSNRWGDYSTSAVDPTNDVDLWTQQEYAYAHDTNDISRWATWWGKVAPASRTTTTGGFNGGQWALANLQSASSDRIVFNFGRSGDHPVPGDWDGNRSVTPGVVRSNVWYLRNANNGGAANMTFAFGRSTDTFFAGDWNFDGIWTPAVHRGTTFYLKQSFSNNNVTAIGFGRTTDTPIVGDWEGDGFFDIGVKRGNTFFLRRTNGTVMTFTFGRADDVAVMGDWDGNGTWTPGLLRGGATWYLSNTNGPTSSVITFADKTAGIGISGNWNGTPA